MNLKLDEQELNKLRHSAAHLLAHAVTDIFPKTKLTIGPATEDGFFYDFLPEKNFKEEDLPLIEEQMQKIVQANYPIDHKEISKTEARKLYHDNPFKLELINGIEGETVGLAVQGPFYDLCKGGHVATTGGLKHTKLLAISGSYWRADRSKTALQRIYGTAFKSEQELADYLRLKEEAQKYDHRKLGKQLDLFSFHDEAPGAAFFHDKGMRIINSMRTYLRSLLLENNYQEISTPVILDLNLWKQSGHLEHYKQNMFFCTTQDEMEYALRPMNCPGAILVYKERPRSYRELPLKLAEFGLDHRYELSGVLHGLMRVRAFTMDDAHIFCTPDQIEEEILNTIKIAQMVHKRLGFEKVNYGLATRPEKAMGSDWEKATNALKTALKKSQIEYEVHEGDGAFYGPKIDLGIEDSMGRKWQLSTIQVDFCQPENFDLEYVASGGQKKRPVMIHRAIFGSIERCLGILLEHHKGRLPFWLSPVQIKILTITDEQKDYAFELAASLKKLGIQVEVDQTSEQISTKIKVSQLQKIPLMIIVGKKEVQTNTATLRYADGKQESSLSFDEIKNKIIKEM